MYEHCIIVILQNLESYFIAIAFAQKFQVYKMSESIL